MSTLRRIFQPMILLILFCFLTVGIVQVLEQYPLTEDLVRDKPPFLTTQQPSSATILWLLVYSFCGNVRDEIQLALDKNPQN